MGPNQFQDGVYNVAETRTTCYLELKGKEREYQCLQSNDCNPKHKISLCRRPSVINMIVSVNNTEFLEIVHIRRRATILWLSTKWHFMSHKHAVRGEMMWGRLSCKVNMSLTLPLCSPVDILLSIVSLVRIYLASGFRVAGASIVLYLAMPYFMWTTKDQMHLVYRALYICTP